MFQVRMVPAREAVPVLAVGPLISVALFSTPDRSSFKARSTGLTPLVLVAVTVYVTSWPGCTVDPEAGSLDLARSQVPGWSSLLIVQVALTPFGRRRLSPVRVPAVQDQSPAV